MAFDVSPTTKLTLYSVAGISGVALLITAIVETVKAELALYHAILVIHIN